MRQGDRERDGKGPPVCPGAAAPGPPPGHLPSGIVKVNKEPIIPKFGEHLVVVTVHVSCKGGQTLRTSEPSPFPRRAGQSPVESGP